MKAEQTAARLMEAGYHVLVPHSLDYRLDRYLSEPKPDQYWLDFTMELMRRCDGVIYMDGYSVGTGAELLEAKELGLPIMHIDKALACQAG